MTTVLILFAGSVTDRIGGAGAMLYGNIIFSIGAILVAAATTVRSYNFMILGVIVQSLGDIATQVAQYKVFGKIWDRYTVGRKTFANSLAVCLTPPPLRKKLPTGILLLLC